MKKLPHNVRFALDFPDIVLAQQVPVKRVTPSPLLAFRPGACGYGNSTHWPFDVGLAMTSEGYREGVRRASNNVAYDSSWRWHAQVKLIDVDAFVQQVHETRKWALWYHGPSVYAALLEMGVI